ncbi:membrane-bound alkaline phosphatase-like [Achroia grisella]|uniref:membrane-bound alkaline phosphatase-like n=1 Tax=Achroia grisella TaxID=688607 RepID=UPI0027D2D8CE|nr:membrane-bound alkaline phosphatase-like [Achroia grisella]
MGAMGRGHLLLLTLFVVLLHPSFERDVYHKRQQYPTVKIQEEADPAFWLNEARLGIESRLSNTLNRNKARNVVLFLGDGMSLPTLAAARTLQGQREGRTGEESQLFFETFPTTGLSKTYCVDAQTADSACTATAYLCGVKANRGTLGVTADVLRTNCTLVSPQHYVHSIAEWALADGRDAGIVTTTRVTHASPAGVYAHSAERDWESNADVLEDCPMTPNMPADIAQQLVHSYPGTHLKVILGGGRREFLPVTVVDEEGTEGKRLDGRNLIDEWLEDKTARNVSHEYVWNRRELMRLSTSPPEYLLGLFEGNHMQYNLKADPDTEPSLADMTEVAIRSLSRNDRGFFLFVEGGRIDHAHHDNLVQLALDESIELAAAVRRAAELLGDESLVVVTADHAHVMSYGGYSRRGAGVLGAADDRGDDGLPYMTLSYANGPGARPHLHGRRPDVTAEEDFGDLDWKSHAEVPLEEETHGGEDVAVFAAGPYHDLFTGTYEQSRIPHMMAYAACIGPGPHACHH